MLCETTVTRKVTANHSSSSSNNGLGFSGTFSRIYDSGYPHDGRANKNPYPHDRRAVKDSYPHDSNNQCIILRLQLSFVMINVQLMLV